MGAGGGSVWVGMLAAMSTSASSPRSPGDARARSSGDACPGSLRLHPADDGALARVRIPGGVLTPAQADALGEAARRLGDGELHLTSRGNVQLRGLGRDCGGELAHVLRAAGLLPSELHERVRNIVASPLSGLDGLGRLGRDGVRPWLAELDRLLCGSDKAAALSGRFLFALDDGRGDVDALGADVTLLADDDGGALLRVGGSDDAVVGVPVADGPRAALLAAEVFLDVSRGTGAWRVKDLPESVLAGLADVVVRELAGSAGVSVIPRPPRPCPAEAASPVPGRVPGPGVEVALSVGVPLGRLCQEQWRLLSDAGELRLTPWRGVVVTGVAPDRAQDRLRALAAAGLITGAGSPWAGVGACIGRPGCAKSLADVRADAEAAVRTGRAGGAGGATVGSGGPLPVYWSGCERRCGHPRGEWVDVVATPDGHRISRVRGDDRWDDAVELTRSAAAPDELAGVVAAARTPRN